MSSFYYGPELGGSMSRRAWAARCDGKYPKTDFKRIHHVTEKSFKALVANDIIVTNEWHHTSKYGNMTDFYEWSDDDYEKIYHANKRYIDKLSREENHIAINNFFDEEIDKIIDEYLSK